MGRDTTIGISAYGLAVLGAAVMALCGCGVDATTQAQIARDGVECGLAIKAVTDAAPVGQPAGQTAVAAATIAAGNPACRSLSAEGIAALTSAVAGTGAGK